MLKDGYFEAAARYYITDIKAYNLFTQEQEDKMLMWIDEMALKYSTDPATTQQFLSAYRLVPKGQFPFGATGAP